VGPSQVPEVSNNITYQFLNADISNVINHMESTNSVVQAASQFNLLEMGYDYITPEQGINMYVHDNTQGPRVALASPVGTYFRNYAIFEGEPQTKGNQINTLENVLTKLGYMQIRGKNPEPGEYLYLNGYCYINPPLEPHTQVLLNILMNDYLQVGVQWNSPLLIDESKKICQVYCSALPIAYSYQYNLADPDYKQKIAPLAKAILTSAYKCTLQVAVNKLSGATPRINVFLTAVGGGVFGNDNMWIADAVAEAIYEYKKYPLDIIMVQYGDVSKINKELEFDKLKANILKIDNSCNLSHPRTPFILMTEAPVKQVEKIPEQHMDEDKRLAWQLHEDLNKSYTYKYLKYKHKYLKLKNK
jgi:hypothetical protein